MVTSSAVGVGDHYRDAAGFERLAARDCLGMYQGSVALD
jgi:hypothetical protein